MKTKYEIFLFPSEEGFAVQAPSLPGCWSQGATTEEAVENIRIAIREYLGAGDEPPNGEPLGVGPGGAPELNERFEIREVELLD